MTQTLTTTEELKHLASSDNANELTRRLARECLANREAQPVALIDRRPGPSRVVWRNGGDQLPHGTELYTAPPAPAVVNLPTEFYSDEGIVIQLEKVMAALAIVGVRFKRNVDACRAAMLAQPVSQYFKSQTSINTNDDRAMRLPESPEGGNG